MYVHVLCEVLHVLHVLYVKSYKHIFFTMEERGGGEGGGGVPLHCWQWGNTILKQSGNLTD